MPGDFLTDEEMDQLTGGAEGGSPDFLSDAEMDQMSGEVAAPTGEAAFAPQTDEQLGASGTRRMNYQNMRAEDVPLDQVDAYKREGWTPVRTREESAAASAGAEHSLLLGGWPRAKSALRAALDPEKDYAEVFDEERARAAAAQEAHPGEYAAGQLGGALVDPTNLLNPAVKGGALLNAARQGLAGASRGAVRGGLQSDAEDAEGVARDALQAAAGEGVLGAGIGAAVGPAAGKGARVVQNPARDDVTPRAPRRS